MKKAFSVVAISPTFEVFSTKTKPGGCLTLCCTLRDVIFRIGIDMASYNAVGWPSVEESAITQVIEHLAT